MPVVKSKQSKSRIDFLQTLRDLEVELIRICDKTPKKHKFFKDEFLIRHVAGALSYAKMGNSIKAEEKDKELLGIRLKYMQQSRAHIQAFISQIDVLQEIFPDNGITEKQLERIGELTKDAVNLLTGVINYDAKRYHKF